jgi:hypothetical protein
MSVIVGSPDAAALWAEVSQSVGAASPEVEPITYTSPTTT